MLNRRKFLKFLGAFGVVFLAPLDKLIDTLSLDLKKDSSPTGELYEGFVLLEKDMPIPFFVQVAPCPLIGPINSSEENNPIVNAKRGEFTIFSSITSLIDNVKFPIFVPDSLPNDFKFLQGHIIKFSGSGEVWEARIDFGRVDYFEPLVSLSARPVFTRPYPVWPDIGYPPKDPDQVIMDNEYFVVNPQKVDYTPRPGIMKITDRGYMLQWIMKDILYTMSVSNEEWRNIPESVGKSLVQQ